MTNDAPNPTEPPTFTKVCRRCSVQTQDSAAFCPSCGTSFGGKRRFPWKVLSAVLAVLVVVVGATGVMLKVRHDHAVAQERHIKALAAAEAMAAKKVAEEKAAKQASDQAAADQAERATRAAAQKDLQSTITKDAKKDVSQGTLTGPILQTICNPTNGGSTDDLTARTTSFDCNVVTQKDDDGTYSGYGYTASINWDTGGYSWQYTG